ncbi:MAG: phosphatase PAP2 family protein [Streptomyces sp.]|uniref:phosphatase PAP2 family protein n=1 Tax=Streptomyces sp. TaxID=1931 RepID=UPI003D6B2AAD
MYGIPRALSPPPNSPPPAAPWLRTALALGACAVVLIVLVALGWRPLLRVDAEVADWLHARALTQPAWTQTNRVFSDWVWDPLTMRVLIAVAAVWMWLRGEALVALWCVATVVVGVGVQQGLKVVIDRDRPRWQQPVDTAHYAAMPSGHAMTTALTCVLLLWLVRRSRAGRAVRGLVLVLGCVSVAGVSFTRIALGVHWLTDTLTGALLGVALAAAAAGLWTTLPRGGTRTVPTE